MSVRLIRGSFRGSLRLTEEDPSATTAASSNLHHNLSSWNFVNKEDLRLMYDDGEEVSLMYTKMERVPMRNFGAEVRASLDIAHFSDKAVVLLDISETSPEGVTDLMLASVEMPRTLPIKEEPSSEEVQEGAAVEVEYCCSPSAAEAHAVIFAHENNSVPLLARTIQATSLTHGGMFDYDQSWLCAICNVPSLNERKVVIARLKHPANMGLTCQEVRLFVLVLCPSKTKGTKRALETGRTFATVLADMEVRRKLLQARTQDEFRKVLLQHATDLTLDQSRAAVKLQIESCHGGESAPTEHDAKAKGGSWFNFGRDLLDDLARRKPHYVSDYKDGFTDLKTIQKVVSTTFFLYFACILPSIAFGVLNSQNTHGKIGVKKVIAGQAGGGLFFAIFGGQPLLILLTTAPLAIYIRVINNICQDFELDFFAMYCCVGLWNSFFLLLYSIFGLSRLMKWSTRSTEEIFALFITCAFFLDASKDVAKDFSKNYFSPACASLTNTSDLVADTWLHQQNHHQAQRMLSLAGQNFPKKAYETEVSTNTSGMQRQRAADENHFLATLMNVSNKQWPLASNIVKSLMPAYANDPAVQLSLAADDSLHDLESAMRCNRESSLLLLLLMLGTVWLGLSLYNFNKTPYLPASKRELLADYALPVAVLVLSFVGSFLFKDVHLEPFKYGKERFIDLARMETLSMGAIFGAMGLGFMLSMLFFMDQNIGSAMVNNPSNKLKKGPAYHLDLLVVAILNGVLSVLGLPWMHAAIPHCPLHVRSLAEVEDRFDQGHVYEVVVKARETRVTVITSHILIGLSLFLLPYPLTYIPTAVLDGLFLYMAITALRGNQMFERITLLFTEQAAYPPNHYIRRVLQRKVHLFTCCQVLQLLVLCVVGFFPWPYTKMVFPVVLLLLLPIRHKIIPRLIDQKYLDALDGEHQ